MNNGQIEGREYRQRIPSPAREDYLRIQSFGTPVHEDIHATATRLRNDGILISQIDSYDAHLVQESQIQRRLIIG